MATAARTARISIPRRVALIIRAFRSAFLVESAYVLSAMCREARALYGFLRAPLSGRGLRGRNRAAGVRGLASAGMLIRERAHFGDWEMPFPNGDLVRLVVPIKSLLLGRDWPFGPVGTFCSRFFGLLPETLALERDAPGLDAPGLDVPLRSFRAPATPLNIFLVTWWLRILGLEAREYASSIADTELPFAFPTPVLRLTSARGRGRAA